MSENSTAAERVTNLFNEMSEENAELKEQLTRVEQMFALEDQNWKKVWSGVDSTSNIQGLSLKQVHEVSEKIREMIVGSPIIDRGTALRASYIWSKGLIIPGTDSTSDKRGPKTALQKFYRSRTAQRYLLGSEAHDEMERSAASDGIYALIGDDETREIHPVPVREISGLFMNPEYAGDVWAYKRTWSVTDSKGNVKEDSYWYYTDTYEGQRETVIGPDEDRTPVAKDKTIIVQSFNTQTGWPLGVPDALSAIVWAQIYSELLNHGKVMTEALAKFALKVTTPTQNGANKVGMKMAGSAPSGQTAALGIGQDLVPLSSAGKAYDFNGIRPIAAMVATALEVSIVHLLSDPGAAGSSYGSASNLDLPTKRAMVARQNTWSTFISRVLNWATDQWVDVTFPNLDDPDPYREMQLQAISWGTGLIHPDEARAGVLQAGTITPRHTTPPKGVLLPNNEASLPRADVDGDATAAASASGGTQGASPDQGKSNGSGGTASKTANDLQESLREVTRTMNLDRLESLVERMEALGISAKDLV